MSSDQIVLGPSAGLENKGEAISFRVIKQGRIYPAFVFRIQNQIRAFLNVCPHMGLRLNRESTNLFHRENDYLFCRSHGAGFHPLTGVCFTGPCVGKSLIYLAVVEDGDRILYRDEEYDFYAGI